MTTEEAIKRFQLCLDCTDCYTCASHDEAVEQAIQVMQEHLPVQEPEKTIGIQDAINHFKHGVSHDIFQEPVTTYVKMAIAALCKQQECEVRQDKEYIERDAVMQALVAFFEPVNTAEQAVMLNYMLKAINLFPAADVAPVVHAEWVTAGAGITERVVCSHCKSAEGSFLRPPICNQCGARMDGGSSDGSIHSNRTGV